jgi:hypothetical protein
MFGASMLSARGGEAHAGEDHSADEVGPSVEGERPARARRGHERAPERRADDVRAVPGHAEQDIRGLELPDRDRLRDEPLRGGEEERERAAAQDLQGDQVPQPRVTGQEQDGDRSLRGGTDGIRTDHDQVAGEPVGKHAAEQDEHELRNPVRREHEAEVALRAGQVEDAERERDRGHRRPQHRDELSAEEQPKRAMGERPESAQTRMQAAR